jgi:hypothetical protein
VTDRDARLVAGSLALEASWCAASLVAVSFALLAANVGPSRTSLTLFLIVAPLAPLAGVALAFGRRIDPTFEIAQASPIPSIRVLLIRALAILGLTIPVLLMLSVPFGRVLAFGWLLPALALAAGALAAGTFVPLTAAAAGLAGLWVVGAVFSLSEAHRRTADAFAGRFVMLQWQGQLLCAVVAVVSLAVLAARRHSYEVVS